MRRATSVTEDGVDETQQQQQQRVLGIDPANLVLGLLCILILMLTSSLVIIFTDPHYLLTILKSYQNVPDIFALEHDHTDTDFTQFLIACSQGQVDKVHNILHFHPYYLNQYSADSGDTCLHVAAILGQAGVTQAVLDAGANPNVRTKHRAGHRMTPLAWNVYTGHYDTIKVLVEHPRTDINLDVDCMRNRGDKVTVLDLAYNALPLDHLDANHKPSSDDNHRTQTFYKIKELLLKHGAKTYAEIEEERKYRDDEL